MRSSMSKKIVALVLIATMSSGYVVSAATAEDNKSDIEKSESVYVNLDSNGDVEKTTVSNWLHSTNGNIKNYSDINELDNIVNVKSKDKPTISGDKLKWNVDSSDIYYQGTTDKKLPIGVNVTYYLNGEKISADKLAGKSGKVKIDIEVVNNEYEEKEISGEKRKIYTPFSTALEVTFPTSQFSSLKTDNGIMVSEGNNTIVTFVAFPGLKDSLDIDENSDLDLDVNLDSKITIEADVEKFSLGPIMVVATPELPDLDKLDTASTIDELQSSLDELGSASNKLVDGTNKLYNGIHLAVNKLNSTLAVVKSDAKMNEIISIMNNSSKVQKTRKVIDDAYYAKDLDTAEAKKMLNMLTNENAYKISALTGDLRTVYMYRDLLNQTLTLANKLQSDSEFNELLQKATTLNNAYLGLSDNGKVALNSMTSMMTPQTLIGLKKIVSDYKTVENDFGTSSTTLEATIAQCPGNTLQEKTMAFMTGLNNSLDVTKNLMSNDTITLLQSLSSDMTDYTMAYLTLKSILASNIMPKDQLKQVISAVYGSNAELVTMLTGYIDGITQDDLSAAAIQTDIAKIQAYRNSLPTLITGVSSLSTMSPLINAIASDMSDSNKLQHAATLLAEIKDPTTDELLDSLGSALVSFSDEDLVALSNMLTSLSGITESLQKNQETLQQINTLLEGLNDNQNLLKDMNKFNEDLTSADSLISQMNSSIGNMNAASLMQMKSLGNNLLSMQQDLKDSEDILRITKEALQQGNVDRAKTLMASLPTLESKIGELKSGSKTLYDGMKKFNDEGINKLCDTGDKAITDIDDLMAVKDEIVAQSKEYDTFSGKSEDTSGKVKFIMKTAEIKYTEKDKDSSKKKTEEKGFIAWIKKLFNID